MTTKNIVFIDSRVAGYETLIASLSADTEWYLLDAHQDGVDQMQRILAGYSELDSVQVISHGSTGTLYLGSTVLNGDNLSSYQTQLQVIGSSLTETGDILLYGCNVAQGDVGVSFVNSLAQITGADVAASTDLTGAVAQGGDALLEWVSGKVETTGIDIETLVDTLAANTAPTFVARDGSLLQDLGFTQEYPTDIAVLPSGRILASFSDGYWNNDPQIRAYTTSGEVDPGFGNDGVLQINFGAYDAVNSMLVLTDGNLLVAGRSSDVSGLILHKYDSSGNLDSRFGEGGVVRLPFNSADFIELQQQTDGKLLIGLRTGYAGEDIVVARLNPNGQLDAGFGQNGIVMIDYDGTRSDIITRSMTLQNDGKILLGGYSTTNYIGGVMARLLSDGSLDTAFGSGGFVRQNLGPEGEYLNNVVVTEDGTIFSINDYNGRVTLARYNSAGLQDMTFGSQGKVMLGNPSRPMTTVLDQDGNLFIGGTSHDGRYWVASSWKFNPSGQLDSEFGSNGISFPYKGLWPYNNGFEGEVYTAYLQSDGKIIGAARVMNDILLYRLDAQGDPDLGFSPAENTLDNSPLATEQGTVVLDPGVQIVDAELAASGAYAGSTLTLSRQGGSNVQDVFSNTGTLSVLNQGSFFAVDGVTIGRITTNSNGTLVLSFNSNATQSLVNKAMQQIAYSNTSDAPPSSVTINWTFNDGNTWAQGTGGALSVTGASTVTIVSTNDAPINGNLLQAQTAVINTPFTYILPSGAFSDPDLDSLTYSISMADGTGTPPWLKINTATGTLLGTPDPLDLGTFTLRITARDASGATASGKFNLIVASGLVLEGTSGNDRLTGNGGNDTLNGLAGNDTLDGGSGTDSMTGGDGSDVYYVRDSGDFVIETNAASAGGIDTVYSYLSSYTLTANVENGRIYTSNAASLTGNTLNNVIYAGAGNNSLIGGEGTDTLSYYYGVTGTTGVTVSLASTTTQTTGGSGSDTISGFENLYGSNNNDSLTGSSGNNVLNGYAGTDTLVGGAGDDTYYVDVAGDVITETNTGGKDLVLSSFLGTYVMGNHVEEGRINTTGTANLTGNSLNNVLYAGAGNNILHGGTGTEIDTVSYQYGLVSGATLGVNVSLLLTGAQATGRSGSDTLTNIENLTGSSLNDTLIGSAGNNVLDGGSGTDSLVGGLGNDTYVMNTSADIIVENANEGTDTVNAFFNGYTLGANIEYGRISTTGTANITGNSLSNILYAGAGNNVISGGTGTEADTVSYADASSAVNISLAITTGQATGGSGTDTLTNIENLTGSNFNDTLTGNAGNNVLDGGAGDDNMAGGAGNDTYYVRQTNDIVTEAASAGTDTVYSYLSSYTLTANVENGRIVTTTASNMTGNVLSNTIYAGAGNNLISGGTGTEVDTVSYQYGLVSSATTGVNANLATGAVTGSSGVDTLTRIENLIGSSLNDTLVGSAGNNSLNGGSGNDSISGGDGNDTLIGGAGKDTLVGSNGNDIFDFNALSEMGATSTTWDVISGFVSGQDRIDLSTLDANTATTTNDVFDSLTVGGTFSGSFASAGDLYFDNVARVLYGNTDGDVAAEFAIQITGVTTLATSDFIL